MKSNTWEECSTTFLSKFFPTGKPMLYVEKSPISSSRKASQFQRHGTFARIYIRLSSPWNKRMDALTKLLPWIQSKSV
jgi:hypothetical protein